MTSMDRLRSRLDNATPSSNAPGFWDHLAQPDSSAVKQVPTESLHSYARHTFRVRDTDDFQSLLLSVREYGIREPLLVRPSPTLPGDYEIIAGHRRHRAAAMLGLSTVPCIIENVSDDYTADQLMGITNLQRPGWLPSERARTYKLYMEAERAKGQIRIGRPAKSNSGTGFQSIERGKALREVVAQQFGISGKALEQYIKLNDLIPGLLDLTDDDRIQIKAAYQLAFIPQISQEPIYQVLQDHPEIRVTAVQGAALRAAGSRLSIAVVEELLGLGGAAQKPKTYTDYIQTPRDVFRRYKQDEELQRRLAETIDRYVAERERR